MKAWQKVNSREFFGPTVLEWRHRDFGRFGGKVFSWLLGAFVFGILTSILFSSIGQADAAQSAARVVFFAVFIAGITSSFFRCFISGISYQITKQSLVHVHPYFGWGKTDPAQKTETGLFKESLFTIDWITVKEIHERKNGFMLLLNDTQTVNIPIVPVAKLSLYLNMSANEPRAKNPQKTDKPAYDKEVMRLVIKAARDAHKSATR